MEGGCLIAKESQEMLRTVCVIVCYMLYIRRSYNALFSC